MLSHVRTYSVGRFMNEDARSVARSAPARQPFRRPAEGSLSGKTLERRQWSRATRWRSPDPAGGSRHGETPFVRLAPRLTEEAAP
ncbi:hypothetical protein GCM10017752_23130 [Streptomyces roseoviridis]